MHSFICMLVFESVRFEAGVADTICRSVLGFQWSGFQRGKPPAVWSLVFLEFILRQAGAADFIMGLTDEWRESRIYNMLLAVLSSVGSTHE